MKTKLQVFLDGITMDYAQRVNHVEVDFDDQKMKQKLQLFYLLWLLENTDPDKVTVNTVEELIKYAKQLHYDGQGYHMAKDKDRVYMSDFIQEEMVHLNVFPPECDPSKARFYKAYLIKVALRFQVLKSLNEELVIWRTNTGFTHYFEHAFEAGFVNVLVVDRAVSFFLRKADNQYFYQLLDRENSFCPQILTVPETNDLKFQVNPPLLLGNEEKKKQYKKVLGTWLLAKLEERIYQYRLDKQNLPEPYLFVKQTAEALFYNQKTTIEIENLLPEKTATIDFNPRIFKDALSFQLFEKQNRADIKPTDLSFLYRKMAEKEKPPLILVRDKEFRDWYAKEYNPETVRSFTKTFDRAFSKERNDSYERAKSEVFEST